MKQLKKMVLILMCTGAMLGMTACGNDGNADDNAANNNAADDNNNNNGNQNNGNNNNNAARTR